MYIKQLHLKNFRCFSDLTLELGHPLVLLEGPNGVGKTSIVEALHYICYLRSFRTHMPKELVKFDDDGVSIMKDGFFIKALVETNEGLSHELQVGFSQKKRLVKVDQKPVQSFKELMHYYRVITLTEDDLALIKQGPDLRRSFLDQALVILDPDFVAPLRNLKSIVEHRNALFFQEYKSPSWYELYELWTMKLWEQTVHIQQVRIDLLKRLERSVNELLTQCVTISPLFKNPTNISFTYEYKKQFDSVDQATAQRFCEEERRLRRSLFGAHLDDFSIHLGDKKSKIYASRGQQKLIMVLLKIAQMKELSVNRGQAIFLLDDFMTDFDQATVEILISLLVSLHNQLIFTCPINGGILEERILERGGYKAKLTHRILSS